MHQSHNFWKIRKGFQIEIMLFLIWWTKYTDDCILAITLCCAARSLLRTDKILEVLFTASGSVFYTVCMECQLSNMTYHFIIQLNWQMAAIKFPNSWASFSYLRMNNLEFKIYIYIYFSGVPICPGSTSGWGEMHFKTHFWKVRKQIYKMQMFVFILYYQRLTHI